MQVLPSGVRHMPGYLDRDAQEALVEDIRRRRAGSAALRAVDAEHRQTDERADDQLRPARLGDRQGRRLSLSADPSGHRRSMAADSGGPASALEDVSAAIHMQPEACLVNFYTAEAKMGLHQDRDEQDFDAPVVSVSLGDACLFRVGETTRSGKTISLRLRSGDVVVLGGEGRLAFHGVDRIYPATSALLKNGGRINLTLRRVTVPT